MWRSPRWASVSTTTSVQINNSESLSQRLCSRLDQMECAGCAGRAGGLSCDDVAPGLPSGHHRRAGRVRSWRG